PTEIPVALRRNDARPETLGVAVSLVGPAVEGPDDHAHAGNTEPGRRIDDPPVESDIADRRRGRRRNDRGKRHEADASAACSASTTATSAASALVGILRRAWAGNGRGRACGGAKRDLLRKHPGTAAALLRRIEDLLRARAPYVSRRPHAAKRTTGRAQEQEEHDEHSRYSERGDE